MTGASMGKKRKTAACGCWESPLTAELIFGQRRTPSKPVPWKNGVLFLLNMPDEKNAQALMFGDGKGAVERISPAGFNLRTKLHEYGGLPFCTGPNEVFWCNFDDQEIYRQRFIPETGEASSPEQITDSSADQVRYADLLHDEHRKRLICVREDHRRVGGNPGEASNALVAISLEEKGLPQKTGAQTVLFGDSDFVAGPCLSDNGEMLAFLSWSHPHMPWDETEIRCGRLNIHGEIEGIFEADEGSAASRLQPGFDPEGNLHFLSDRSGYWNLARIDAADFGPGCTGKALFSIDKDCCGPPWELGNRNYAVGENGSLYVTVVDRCRWQLFALAGGKASELESGKGLLEHVRIDGRGRLCHAVASDDDYPAICIRDPNAAAAPRQIAYRSPVPEVLSEELISRPRHFEFRGESGAKAYGLLYAPRNPAFEKPPDELPPLLVNVHGGPTGTARAALNPMHQFWTSRGFAVLDINHRGSTGYGREFRQALDGQWGVVDIEDVIAAVEHLIETRQVDGGRAAIRGGSAGGYVVLASLAACELFSAGVSYYGVADLEMLARDTHKFESRYLDRLVGPYPATRDRYRQRSPINRLGEISAPVMILQGTEDKVVPPSQAELLYAELGNRVAGVEFISFEGEGHGFRQPANQIRALAAELDFYRRNLLA